MRVQEGSPPLAITSLRSAAPASPILLPPRSRRCTWSKLAYELARREAQQQHVAVLKPEQDALNLKDAGKSGDPLVTNIIRVQGDRLYIVANGEHLRESSDLLVAPASTDDPNLGRVAKVAKDRLPVQPADEIEIFFSVCEVAFVEDSLEFVRCQWWQASGLGVADVHHRCPAPRNARLDHA
eukprot:7380166-Prymnesium_polylepis.2